MRIIVEVPTINKRIHEIRALGIKKIDEYIAKTAEKCPVCKHRFLPERRTRKKYCSNKCRWEVGKTTALARYHRRKKAREEAAKTEGKMIRRKVALK